MGLNKYGYKYLIWGYTVVSSYKYSYLNNNPSKHRPCVLGSWALSNSSESRLSLSCRPQRFGFNVGT